MNEEDDLQCCSCFFSGDKFIATDHDDEERSKYGVPFSKEQQVLCIKEFDRIHDSDDEHLYDGIQPVADTGEDPDRHEDFGNADEPREEYGVIRAEYAGNDELVAGNEVEEFAAEAVDEPDQWDKNGKYFTQVCLH